MAPNYLLHHFLNQRQQDPRSPLLLTAMPRRLVFEFDRIEGDWNTVAGFVGGPNPWPVVWCPDANVAFLDATAPVWDALRLAALGPYGARTVISGVAEAEMEEWLTDPRHHVDRAAAIKDALDAETWIRRTQLNRSSRLFSVACNYTHLLGVRRSLALPCSDGTTLVGTLATDKSDTMNSIQNTFGPRALGLARKGRRDAQKKGAINISDELHCIVGILHALQTRENTVILTADADFLEIFYKAQWFLDTHYRGWLTAKLIRSGRYGEPNGEISDTRCLFEGPVTLYQRATAQMHEVLPLDASAVRVTVLYVAPHSELQIASFPFELQMLSMLETRAATGRSTDEFGESNIHIDLGPLGIGLSLGIGRDSTVAVGEGELSTSLAKLDVLHSVHCRERFTAY